jgi:hypothetical protein
MHVRPRYVEPRTRQKLSNREEPPTESRSTMTISISQSIRRRERPGQREAKNESALIVTMDGDLDT